MRNHDVYFEGKSMEKKYVKRHGETSTAAHNKTLFPSLSAVVTCWKILIEASNNYFCQNNPLAPFLLLFLM